MALLSLDKQQPEEFYAAIGRALTVWSSVENSMCHLFCRCVGRANGFPANHAYWAVVSFDGKLKMTDHAMTAAFPDKHALAPRWKKIHKHLQKRNARRNEIAHGTLVTMPYRDKKTKKPVNDLFFAPYFWGRLGKNLPAADDARPERRMYLDDIRTATQKFSALDEQIRELAAEVYEIMHSEVLFSSSQSNQG